MNCFKKVSNIVVVSALCIAPLVQARRAYRTGITSINTTRVRIVNNTNRTFLAKNILCNKLKVKGGIFGYKIGKTKTKNFSPVTIRPGKSESILLVDRDLPVGAFYAAIKENKPMPYEEWGMDVVDQKDSTCKFAAIVRSSRGPMLKSMVGSSFGGIAELYRKTYYMNAMLGTGTTATLGLFAVAATGIMGTIDVFAQTIGQFVSSIGAKIIGDPPCARISQEFKWQGGLYKNLFITINPKPAKPAPGKSQERSVKMAKN